MKKVLIVAAFAALLSVALAAPVMAQEQKGAYGQITPMVGCEGQSCWPVYSYRDLDTDVKAIRYLLRYRGFANFQITNGYFGPRTVAAVRNFQKKRGLTVTGNVNRPTWQTLVAAR